MTTLEYYTKKRKAKAHCHFVPKNIRKLRSHDFLLYMLSQHLNCFNKKRGKKTNKTKEMFKSYTYFSYLYLISWTNINLLFYFLVLATCKGTHPSTHLQPKCPGSTRSLFSGFQNTRRKTKILRNFMSLAFSSHVWLRLNTTTRVLLC